MRRRVFLFAFPMIPSAEPKFQSLSYPLERAWVLGRGKHVTAKADKPVASTKLRKLIFLFTIRYLDSTFLTKSVLVASFTGPRQTCLAAGDVTPVVYGVTPG